MTNEQIDLFLDGKVEIPLAIVTEEFYDAFKNRFILRLEKAVLRLPTVDTEEFDAYEQEMDYQLAFNEQAERLYTEFQAACLVILKAPREIGIGLLMELSRHPAFMAFFSTMRRETNINDFYNVCE